MTSEENKNSTSQQSASATLNKQSNKRKIIKATLIGFVCGVFFILAAKLVNIALT